MQVAWGAATDAGGRRAANEDAVLAQPPVFLVADGMGGHVHGAMASAAVVRTFAEFSDSWHPEVEVHGADVLAAIHTAQARIRAELSDRGGGPITAGSTVAGAVLTGHEGAPYWLVFNVGDSRVYRFTGGALVQVSVDHSVMQEMLDAGSLQPDQVAVFTHKHVITRAVDSGSDTKADFWLLAAGTQERLVLCTDGLLDELSEDRVAQILAEQSLASAAAETLLAAAIEGGARDNVSVVVVDLAGAGELAHTAPRVQAGDEFEALGTTVPREQVMRTEGSAWQ
ncbi:MAG TPA: protein phosphatase 2C domain-containing protein [Candidatus Ruania gallistercoris]|uniref:Protein phosphatase 2C domain-containing protein n=1 Tax=Candidatus Ruania gallistercoris TaxID=2838746 RepID=A0A9D2EC91_9MICO|nr:protein phosphatase 2C domain-containing protein [Candidatus Ruania gallistercoris]